MIKLKHINNLINKYKLNKSFKIIKMFCNKNLKFMESKYQLKQKKKFRIYIYKIQLVELYNEDIEVIQVEKYTLKLN